MSIRVKIDTRPLEEAVSARIKAESAVVARKFSLFMLIHAISNLAQLDSPSWPAGLSRKRATGQYPHIATGQTLNSLTVRKTGAGWQVVGGGNAKALEYGTGPRMVPIPVLRAWAMRKFPEMPPERMARFLKNLQARIRNGGLRRTRFFSEARKEARKTLGLYRNARQLPKIADLQGQVAAIRAKAIAAGSSRG